MPKSNIFGQFPSNPGPSLNKNFQNVLAVNIEEYLLQYTYHISITLEFSRRSIHCGKKRFIFESHTNINCN